ncbi:MAG: leucine-rich repeat protein [Lachnospiraceae bacterium]|nr:leucine-rich repeat protein [Lachnospiraceae bacterium]
MEKRRLFLVGIMVLALLLSGCALADKMTTKGEKSEGERSGPKYGTEEQDGVPYLIVDESCNIQGNSHFGQVKSIQLHLDAGAFSMAEHDLYKDGFEIRENAFNGCSNLKQITFKWGSNVAFVAEDAFDGCSKDLTIYCDTDTYLWNRLQELGIHTEDVKPVQRAEYTGNLEKDFPDYLGDYDACFLMDTENTLVGVSYDGVQENMVMHLPEETKKIGDFVFLFFDGVSEVVIPEQVEEIGNCAFANMEDLKKVSFMGNSLKKIGDKAFAGSVLEQIEIPEGVEQIGFSIFTQLNMKELILPESLQTVDGNFVAYGIDDLVFNGKNVQIKGLIYYDDADIYCFKDSETEKSITEKVSPVKYLEGPRKAQPVRETQISSAEPIDTAVPEKVQEGGEGTPYLMVDKDYNVIGNRHFQDVRCIDLSMETGGGLRVVQNYEADSDLQKRGYKIGTRAFENCLELRQITVASGNNVTYVAEDAFYGCSDELTVYCEKDTYLWNRLREIGIQVKDVKQIEDAVEQSILKKYPEYDTKEDNYFVLNSDYTLIGFTRTIMDTENGKVKVELPEETRKIGKEVFMHFSPMEEIIIPKYVEEIGDYAFMEAAYLKKVTFQGHHLKKIGESAFMHCQLKSFKLPEGVEEIGDGAFSMVEFKKFAIPKSAKIVGDEFVNSSWTDKLIIKGMDTQFGNLQKIDGKNTTIYCYKDSKAEEHFKKLGFQVKYLSK